MSVDMFPIPLPIQDWESVDVSDPQRRQAGGVLGSGRDFVIDRGQAFWKLTAKTRKLFPAEINLMAAFKAKLRGSARFCTFYDPVTEYPAAYMPKGPPPMLRAGLGLGFDGHCSLAAIASSGLPGGVGRDIVSFGAPYALPVGLVLGGGDKLELRQGANLLAPGAQTFASGWTTMNCAYAQDAAIAPDGTPTAVQVTKLASGAMAFACQFPASEAAGWYRFAVWLNAGALTGALGLTVEDAAGGNATTTTTGAETLCAADGAPLRTSGGAAFAVAGGGWRRCETVGYIPPSAPTTLQVAMAPTAPGLGGDTFYAWQPSVTQVDAETISLHRVLDGGVADINGNLTAWIEPEVPASFTAGLGGALVNLYRPRGKFRILSLETPVNAQGRARPGQCTFTAQSTLL